jgi:hypothetical protein
MPSVAAATTTVAMHASARSRARLTVGGGRRDSEKAGEESASPSLRAIDGLYRLCYLRGPGGIIVALAEEVASR